MICRRCGFCRRGLRWDEDMEVCQRNPAEGGPTETGYACPDCQALIRGTERPPPRTYPVGQPVPTKPGTSGITLCDLPICALCRLARWEDDAGEPMRLLGEDLSDELWRAYTRALREQRQQLDAEATAARAAFVEAARPYQDQLDGRLARLQDELAANLAQIEAVAPDQGAYEFHADLARTEHERQAKQAGEAFEAATAEIRKSRDARLFRAGADYRQRALAVHAELAGRYPVPEAPEPGCYMSCRDCVARWRPRIRERLIRLRIVPADFPLESMQHHFLL